MRVLGNNYDDKGYINTLSLFHFDGIDDYIRLVSGDFASNEFTVSFFFIYENTANATYMFDYSLSTSSNIGIQITTLSNNRIFVRVNSTTTPILLITPNDTIKPNTLYHLGLIGSDDTIKLYLNGSPIQTATNTGLIDVESLKGSVNPLTLTLGTNATNNGLYPLQMAHFVIFDRALNESEFDYLYFFAGYVYESFNNNCIFYLPLQYNNFKKHQIFNDNAAIIPTNVNQITHGFSLNNVVVDDGGYRLATLTDAEAGLLELRIVTNVIGVDDFQYGTAGVWNAGFTYENGTLLYLHNDGTLSSIQTDYPLAVVVNGGDGQIGFVEELITYSSVTQFNPQKALVDIISEEYKAIVHGKTWEELNYLDKNGYPYPVSYGNKDFYNYDDNHINHYSGRVYNGVSTFDTVNSWNRFNYTQAFSISMVVEISQLGKFHRLITDRFSSGDEKGIDINIRSDNTLGFTLVNTSASTGNLLNIRTATPLDKDKKYHILIFSNGTGKANGIKIIINKVVQDLIIIKDNLTATIVGSSSILTLGRSYLTSNAFLNGIIYKLEIVNVDYQGTINEGIFIKYQSMQSHVNENEFLFRLKIDEINKILKTDFNTPIYTIASNQLSLTGKLEVKSDLPVIQQGLRIVNASVGGTRNEYISLDKTNLPSATDDFTFMWTGTVNDTANYVGAASTAYIPIFFAGSDLAGANDFMLFRIFTKHSTLTGTIRMSYKSSGVNYNLDLTNAKDKIEGDILQGCVTMKGNLMSFYINGVLVSSITVAVKFNMATVSTYEIAAKSIPAPAGNYYKSDIIISDFRQWNRALSHVEINQAYNNSNIANPLLYNSYKVDGLGLNSQRDLIRYHIFNKDLFYDDGGIIKLKNLIDVSGVTDAICNEYSTLDDVHENNRDFRELRLPTEVII